MRAGSSSVDVARVLANVAEPSSSVRLAQWIGSVRARLTQDQRTSMERWFNDVPLDSGALNAFRANQLDVLTLSRIAQRLGRRDRKTIDLRERASPVATLVASAVNRPAVTSTIIWHLLGATEPELASHLIHAIRERAGLPGLRRRIEPAELPVKPEVTWFDDRQTEDAAAWAEKIPAPIATTLADAIAHVEAQRASSNTQVTKLVPFLQRTASFILTLSTQKVDPLGFALSRNARLVVDPPLTTRMDVAAWGRSVDRMLSLRGQMAILGIDVVSPWPLTLEIIATDLGRGASGALGVVMRLRGDVALPPTAEAAPVLLCMPDEPMEVLGGRFERWSQRAYPHAIDPWRAFA